MDRIDGDNSSDSIFKTYEKSRVDAGRWKRSSSQSVRHDDSQKGQNIDGCWIATNRFYGRQTQKKISGETSICAFPVQIRKVYEFRDANSEIFGSIYRLGVTDWQAWGISWQRPVSVKLVYRFSKVVRLTWGMQKTIANKHLEGKWEQNFSICVVETDELMFTL